MENEWNEHLIWITLPINSWRENNSWQTSTCTKNQHERYFIWSVLSSWCWWWSTTVWNKKGFWKDCTVYLQAFCEIWTYNAHWTKERFQIKNWSHAFPTSFQKPLYMVDLDEKTPVQNGYITWTETLGSCLGSWISDDHLKRESRKHSLKSVHSVHFLLPICLSHCQVYDLPGNTCQHSPIGVDNLEHIISSHQRILNVVHHKSIGAILCMTKLHIKVERITNDTIRKWRWAEVW